MNNFEELLDEGIFDWDNFPAIAEALVRVDKHSLTSEMLQLPAQYAYYHTLMVKAQARSDSAEGSLDKYRATKSKECQDVLASSGKKATAKDMENYVNSSATYREKYEDFIKIKEKYLTLKGLVQAVGIKRDMLIQLSSNERAETKLYN
tara:strand:- start:12128 stop:12574 length:447 start_codon:yes stop_codon:yes gene_type:complete